MCEYVRYARFSGSVRQLNRCGAGGLWSNAGVVLISSGMAGLYSKGEVLGPTESEYPSEAAGLSLVRPVSAPLTEVRA
jgi:hypothetical protein